MRRQSAPGKSPTAAGAGRGTGKPETVTGEEGRRGLLIRESARLFREKGYDATSVRDIAAASGIQSGSWVHHFSTKQDILVAVMEEGLQRALSGIEAIDAEQLPPREKFHRLVRRHLQTILGPGEDFLPVLLYDWRSLDSAASQPGIVALQDRYEKVWDRVIQRLADSGEWNGPTPVDRLLMFGALNWIARWYRPGGGLGIEALTDQCVQFLLRTSEQEPATRRRKRSAARKTGG
jgi:AcrR family transcriptional regulator